jgi:hypothetical protein
MTTNDISAVEKAVRTWFDEYVDTFIDLATASSVDPIPLLKYFATPISMTTSASHFAVTDSAILIVGLRQELESLQAANYGGSTAVDPMVRVLNDRAALVEVTWVRHDRGGKEFQRMRMLYLVAATDVGWRIQALCEIKLI